MFAHEIGIIIKYRSLGRTVVCVAVAKQGHPKLRIQGCGDSIQDWLKPRRVVTENYGIRRRFQYIGKFLVGILRGWRRFVLGNGRCHRWIWKLADCRREIMQPFGIPFVAPLRLGRQSHGFKNIGDRHQVLERKDALDALQLVGVGLLDEWRSVEQEYLPLDGPCQSFRQQSWRIYRSLQRFGQFGHENAGQKG